MHIRHHTQVSKYPDPHPALWMDIISNCSSAAPSGIFTDINAMKGFLCSEAACCAPLSPSLSLHLAQSELIEARKQKQILIMHSPFSNPIHPAVLSAGIKSISAKTRDGYTSHIRPRKEHRCTQHRHSSTLGERGCCTHL